MHGHMDVRKRACAGKCTCTCTFARVAWGATLVQLTCNDMIVLHVLLRLGPEEFNQEDAGLLRENGLEDSRDWCSRLGEKLRGVAKLHARLRKQALNSRVCERHRDNATDVREKLPSLILVVHFGSLRGRELLKQPPRQNHLRQHRARVSLAVMCAFGSRSWRRRPMSAEWSHAECLRNTQVPMEHGL